MNTTELIHLAGLKGVGALLLTAATLGIDSELTEALLQSEPRRWAPVQSDPADAYHVRHANGTTADWLPSRAAALKMAEEEGLQCFEIRGSRATLIFDSRFAARKAA